MAAQNTRDIVPQAEVDPRRTQESPSSVAVPPAQTEQQPVQALPSSPVEPPSVINTSPQQQPAESSSPQDGDEVRAVEQIKKPSEVNREDPNINVVELRPHGPTFKEQVYGYARLIRGTVLGQPDVKEQGIQVLRGEQGIPLRRGSHSSK